MIVEFKELFKPFEILRPTKTKDQHGDWIMDFEVHKESYGYIGTVSGSKQFMAKKDVILSTHKLYTTETDIEKGDRIRDPNGTYSVIMTYPIDGGLVVDLDVVL